VPTLGKELLRRPGAEAERPASNASDGGEQGPLLKTFQQEAITVRHRRESVKACSLKMTSACDAVASDLGDRDEITAGER
jgi:hypothetical protein